jgi:hypothetical protein
MDRQGRKHKTWICRVLQTEGRARRAPENSAPAIRAQSTRPAVATSVEILAWRATLYIFSNHIIANDNLHNSWAEDDDSQWAMENNNIGWGPWAICTEPFY